MSSALACGAAILQDLQLEYLPHIQHIFKVVISPYHPALAPRRTGRRVVTWYSQLSLCEVGFVISTIQAVFLVTITSFYHGILPLLLC